MLFPAPHTRKTIASIAPLAMLLVGLGVGILVGRNTPTGAGALPGRPAMAAPAPAELGDVYQSIYNDITKRYLRREDVTDEKLAYGSIRGMVDALGDQYSYFLTPSEYKDFAEDLQGVLTGIGAELQEVDGRVTVITPLRGSPAERAGLRTGDVIVQVDGENVMEKHFLEVVRSIRGAEGSTVQLTVLKKATDAEPEALKELSIKRERITIPSVIVDAKTYEDKDIAVMTINQFGDSTVAEFQTEVSKLLLQQPAGLVLDLRNNGGGYLEASVEIANEFIRKGMIVEAVDAHDVRTLAEYSDGQGRLLDMPLVVLINEGSASAAEILAGALRDHKRATTVGQTTFGKGTVQDVQEYSDGSALRLTIANWHTPGGQSLGESGITPDVAVELPSDAAQGDTQMKAAIAEMEKKLGQ